MREERRRPCREVGDRAGPAGFGAAWLRALDWAVKAVEALRVLQQRCLWESNGGVPNEGRS